jgi:hypothetical protein
MNIQQAEKQQAVAVRKIEIVFQKIQKGNEMRGHGKVKNNSKPSLQR